MYTSVMLKAYAFDDEVRHRWEERVLWEEETAVPVVVLCYVIGGV